MDSVVAEYEVVTRRDARPPVGFVTSERRIDVRLDETVAIDVDDPVAFRHEFAGKPDDALDEGRIPVAQSTSLRCLGSSEDDDLSPLRIIEPVRKPVGDHTVAESPLAEVCGYRAVERWLHRRRGDAVRLGDLCLKRQDEGNGRGDRNEPIDDRPPGLRYPALSTVENLHGCLDIVRMASTDVGSRNGAWRLSASVDGSQKGRKAV